MMRDALSPQGLLAGLAALLCGVACTSESSSWSESTATEISTAQRERALAARDALKARLLQELGGALERGGAPAAIEVCRAKAPALAQEIAAQHGVRIGRTSAKLRNPGNEPPSWARPAVAAKRGSELWLRGPSGEVGLLDPLRIAPLCLMCHGTEEQIDPLVRAKLRQSYPEDRATGYALEQLRGYVWVEVASAP